MEDVGPWRSDGFGIGLLGDEWDGACIPELSPVLSGLKPTG